MDKKLLGFLHYGGWLNYFLVSPLAFFVREVKEFKELKEVNDVWEVCLRPP